MGMVKMQVRSIMNLGLWDKVCDYKDWNPYIYREGRIDDDEWVEFDDTFEKISEEVEKPYYVQQDIIQNVFHIYETNGDFYNHNTQDRLIGTFEDKQYADIICEMLIANCK